MKPFLSFAILSALCFFVQAESVITLNPAKKLHPVNRNILGNNQLSYPNLQNMPTNGNNFSADKAYGVWDPVKRAPVPEMVAFAKNAGIKVQRYPGGCGSHYFNWKRVIGPISERPWQHFGLHEFLTFCEASNAVPVITLADYYGTAKEAAELVEYLNAPNDGKHPWAAKRAANGREKPFGVIYFECGNETYHGNHRTGKDGRIMYAKEYGKRYLEFKKAMKAVDPKIKLGAIFHSGEWNRDLLAVVGKEIDYLTPHLYVGGYSLNDGKLPAEKLFSIMLAGVNEVPLKLKQFQKELRSCGATEPVPMAVTEFNTHMTQDKPVPYRFSLGGALVVAEMLRYFFYDPNVIMANYWMFANEYWGMIRGTETPYLKRPAYYVYDMFNRYLSDNLLEPEVKTPVFESMGGYGTPRATRKASQKQQIAQEENHLPKQNWRFLKGDAFFEKNVKTRQLPDDVLEVEFKDDSNVNYFHASKVMKAYPLYGYRLTAEIRTEGLERGGASVQIGDGRGFSVTRSAVSTLTVSGKEWKKVSCVYTPLADTNSLIIMARRNGGGSSGRMFIRNISVSVTVPDDIGPAPLLGVTASISKDKKTLSLLIVNKSMKSPESVTLRLPGIKSASAEILCGKSVAAVNETNPETVIIKPFPMKAGKDHLKMTLPPHSLTGIRITR